MNAAHHTPTSIGMAFLRSPAGVDPFYAEFIGGMEDVLHPRGMQVLMQTLATPHDELDTYRRWAANRSVAGVVVSNLTVGDRRGALLAELGVPHVTHGEPEDGAGGAVVRFDNYTTMVHAVQKLVSLGHRRIGRVSGPEALIHTQARTAAFADAIAAAGAGGATEVGDYTAPSGATGMSALLALPEPPTAVIFDNDVMAVAGLGAAQAAGVVVPDELSILAWDDSTRCRLTSPPLSVMSHDVRELGSLAATGLLGVIDGEPPTDVTAPLPVYLERGSTAAPAAPATGAADPAAPRILDAS